MPGVPRELAEHALNVYPDARLVKQLMRRFSEPKRKAIGEEINRLLEANFIWEIKHSDSTHWGHAPHTHLASHRLRALDTRGLRPTGQLTLYEPSAPHA